MNELVPRIGWSSQVTRLLALSLALLATPALPQAFERAAGVIGILPLPEVFGGEACARYEAQDVGIFPSPSAVRPHGRIYVAQQWTMHGQGGCAGLRVNVAITDPVANDGELPTLEFGYEQPGAIVVRRSGSWFEIALGKGTAWVRVADAGRFLPVQKLLQGSLTYLRQGASIPLQPGLGAGPAARVAGSRTTADLPISVLAFKRVGGRLWIQVESLRIDPCTQEKLERDPFKGWLPFHDATARPAVWFHSRGC